jgi:hypothetical protein
VLVFVGRSRGFKLPHRNSHRLKCWVYTRCCNQLFARFISDPASSTVEWCNYTARLHVQSTGQQGQLPWWQVLKSHQAMYSCTSRPGGSSKGIGSLGKWYSGEICKCAYEFPRLVSFITSSYKTHKRKVLNAGQNLDVPLEHVSVELQLLRRLQLGVANQHFHYKWHCHILTTIWRLSLELNQD